MFFWVLYRNDNNGEYEHIQGEATSPYRLAWEADDGENANGLAAIASGKSGVFVAFQLDAPALPVYTNTVTQLTADSALLESEAI